MPPSLTYCSIALLEATLPPKLPSGIGTPPTSLAKAPFSPLILGAQTNTLVSFGLRAFIIAI